MAQVFAGTASESDVVPYGSKQHQKINFYLPAQVYITQRISRDSDVIFCSHHLVESVHFTTSKGQPFHPALACIRTPDRDYYILRDNGMTVGCEEDGIWAPWTELLHCDKSGLEV